jgi:hypothetical protein
MAACEELGVCKEEVDTRITTIEEKLDVLHADMLVIKEILEVWNSAKGFVTGVRVLSTVIRFLAYTAAGATALWLFFKTGSTKI